MRAGSSDWLDCSDSELLDADELDDALSDESELSESDIIYWPNAHFYQTQIVYSWLRIHNSSLFFEFKSNRSDRYTINM